MTSTLLPTLYGRTGLSVSPLCIGTSGWNAITAAEAEAVLTAAAGHGITFVDTSNEYAGGRSEQLLGAALRACAAAGTFVVQTKLDRDPTTGDFGYERMVTSVRESLGRLGIDRVPVLMLHDPEHIGFARAMEHKGPVDALVDLRDRGIAEWIGISGGPVDMLTQFVETDLFDALITHNRMTLLDQTADALLAAADTRGLGVTNAAPFGAGILTGDPRFAGTYAYAPIDAERAATFARLSDVCAETGIPIGAAALQFSLLDPRIDSTVIGISRRHRLDEAVTWATTPIPDEAWSRILAAAGLPARVPATDPLPPTDLRAP